MTCLSNTVELTPPRLAQSCGSAINLTAAAHLLIEIPPYTGMDEEDLIELFWNNCYVTSKVLARADLGQPVNLRVPQSFVHNGNTRIHYKVMQVGQTPVLSAAKRLQVKLDCPGGEPHTLCADENQNLAPVIIPEIIRRRGLNPTQIKRGVPLAIEPYLNMAAGDAITLQWGDARLDLPPLKASDIGQPLNLWVPPALILEAGEDPRLEVTYCILDRAGNNSRWAPPRTLKVGCINPCLIVRRKALVHPAKG
ncbi:hypothetical protein SAMN04487857_11754 [Pseudomonas sp. ok272]|uniref:hypothetical protein n=1 Tax=unclassified Pseudomonas TaxID=196821 RepID=UPI0008C888DB|nr:MULTISPECIES: hypothetical protein [unclassified Pseudomonas]SEN45468.1 hypothetical protein SAMN04487857_11754 [Pseudomonas sp. ok272]SFM81418.1 hypothetical protein SAMN04487858_10754 [Pseudomonas sp. ok602]